MDWAMDIRDRSSTARAAPCCRVAQLSRVRRSELVGYKTNQQANFCVCLPTSIWATLYRFTDFSYYM